MRFHHRQFHLFSVMLALFGSLFFGTGAALAQDPIGTPEAAAALAVVEDTTILVDAATCDAAQCPPYSQFLSNFDISAYSRDTNGLLDSCTTGADGSWCELVIPGDVMGYFLTFNTGQVPTGYAFSEIQESDGNTGPQVQTLVFTETASEMTTVPVGAATCDADQCPPYTELLGGMTIFAFDAENDLLDACTTAGDGSACDLVIPASVTDPILTFGADQVPAGYTFARIDESDGMTGPRTWTLVFVPGGSGETITLPVDAAFCDAGQCPPYTGFFIGLEIIAREEGTGNILDSCTNSSDGCELVIPADALYYLDYGDDVPAGYKFSTVHESDGNTGPRTYTLVFVPESRETQTLRAQAALCDEPTCPPYTSFVGNFEISVYDDDTSELLDSCTTMANGSLCFLSIPENVQFTFSWNPDDIPDGYVLSRVVESDGMTGPRVFTLVMVPESSEITRVLVNAALCTATDCPPYDDFITGIDIFAREDGTGTILSYCTTPPATQNNACELRIPTQFPNYYLDYAPEGVPTGFVFSHIDISDGEMGPVIHTLVFVPGGHVTPTVPPTETPQTPTATSTAISGLPATGSTGTDAGGSTGLLLLASGLLLAGAAALGLHRRQVR